MPAELTKHIVESYETLDIVSILLHLDERKIKISYCAKSEGGEKILSAHVVDLDPKNRTMQIPFEQGADRPEVVVVPPPICFGTEHLSLDGEPLTFGIDYEITDNLAGTIRLLRLVSAGAVLDSEWMTSDDPAFTRMVQPVIGRLKPDAYASLFLEHGVEGTIY